MNIDGVALPSSFLEFSIEFGGVVYFRSESGQCKAMLEIEDDGSLAANFNFHHDCKGKDIDYIKARISEFPAKRAVSKRIIEEYLKQKK